MAAQVYAPTEEWGLGLNEEMNEELVRLPDVADEHQPEVTRSLISTTSEYLIAGAAAIVGDIRSRFTVALNDVRDQRELICAAQREFDHPVKKATRTELQKLDERMAELGKAGPGMDMMSRLGRLMEKYHVALPTITIEYSGIDIKTNALMGSKAVPTVGSAFVNLAKDLLFIKPDTTPLSIVDSVKGVILAGKPTLMLGPPSSGKSSLLKMLCGRMKATKNVKVHGKVTYNGCTFDEFNVIRTTAYVGQVDVHIPQLTVMETLEFARACSQGSGADLYTLIDRIEQAIARTGITRQSLINAQGLDKAMEGAVDDDEKEFLKIMTEIKDVRGIRMTNILRVMGIAHTMDTPVGDSMLRGVSGGERKRVTIAEMIVGGRTTFFLDEISTGLDSATLYSIITTMCKVTKVFGFNMVICLLQPPPEVFNLFDDLMLMAQGRVVYHGPVADAVSLFTSLGFVCPPRKDVPSFLQEVVSQSGQLDYASEALLRERGFSAREFVDGKKRYVMPVDEMVDRYWASPQGLAMQALIDKPFPKELGDPSVLKQGTYALTSMECLKVVIKRQWLLLLKDMGLIRGRLMQSTVVGLMVGSLFYQLEPSPESIVIYFGACFLLVMFVSMGAMVALITALATKNVWYKHRDNLFYPAWIHSVSVHLVQIPLQLTDVLIWTIVTYFMMDFYSDPGYWFTCYAVLITVSLCFGAVFSCIGYVMPEGVSANTMGGLVLLVLIVMSGFTIPYPEIPNYWIWAYWISPYSWSMRSVVVNEMTSPAWGPLGVHAMEAFGFKTTRGWIWAGVGYNLLIFLVFVGVGAAALKWLNGPAKIAAIPDEKELERARNEAKTRRDAVRAAAAAAAVPVQAAAAGMINGEHVVVDMAAEKDTSATIPFTKITLVWKDLRYFVPNPAAGQPDAPAELELLKGITGWAEPGELTALMGGSGAGKTTLMDCIAGRKTVGLIKGDILVNGHPKEQGSWSRVMGYVEQMDIHTPAQTILEALIFSARLRLPSSVTRDQMRNYVDEVIELVDLTEIMFNLVGTPGVSGLSVEQRKRLTIANEMVANPSVMFMDEPTSGLDARAASIVMRTVRNVGDSKRAVLVTIHQPSIEIFETFNNLLLLQRGGRVIYFGGLGTESTKLVAYLQGVPGCEPMRDGVNPATWMLEVTGGAVSVTAKAVEANWPELYNNSELGLGNVKYANELAERDLKNLPALKVEGHGKYASSLPVQAFTIWKKFNAAYWRMPSYNYIRYMMTLAVALVYGSIYFDTANLPNPTSATTVQAVGGVIYLSVSMIGMSSMMAVMPMVGLERVVYYREQAAQMYNPWVYGWIMSLVEVPYQISQAVLFVCVLYPMLHFTRTAESFFYFLFMNILSLMFFVSFGMGLMYSCPSQQLAQIFAAGLNFVFNIFNGYVIPYPSMPEYWKWLNRLSPTTWIIYGLIADQLGNKQQLITEAGSNTTITVSEYMDEQFGYSYDFRLWCLLIVVAYVLFFRVLGMFALRYINYLKR